MRPGHACRGPTPPGGLRSHEALRSPAPRRPGTGWLGSWPTVRYTYQSILRGGGAPRTYSTEQGQSEVVTGDTSSPVPPIDVFKALGDPIRWSMIAQMASVDELACITLEDTLPVSKPTISYHAKILNHAGLITVRKEGRNHFYSLRRDVLHQVLDSLWELAPSPRPVVGKHKGYVSTRRQRRNDAAGRPVAVRQQQRRDAADTGEEAVLLTW